MTEISPKPDNESDQTHPDTRTPDSQHSRSNNHQYLSEPQRLRVLLDYSGDAMFWIEMPSGRVVDLNVVSRDLLGLSSSSEVELSLEDLFPADICETTREMASEDLSGGARIMTVETELSCAFEGILPVEMTIGVHGLDGTTYVILVARDITQRKIGEQALRQSEDRYRQLFENATDAILIMKNDRFIDCNEKALKMYARRREQIVGHSPDLISPALQPDGAASRATAIERINAVLSGAPQVFEWTHSRGDGSLFDAEVSLNKIAIAGEEYIQAIVRDVTDRKRAEVVLRESEMRFRTIFQDIPNVAVQGYDARRRVIFWNAASERLYGYTRAEALGQSLESLMVPADQRRQTIFAFDQWLRLGHPPPTGERTFRRKDGTTVPVFSSHVALTSARGEFEMYRVDVSLEERVRAEQEKELLESQLRQSQKMEAVGQLAGGIAHDFNNLLQVIQGYTDLATEAIPDQDPLAGSLKEIGKASQRATALVRQLLTFSRRQATQPEPLNVHELIDNLTNMIRRLIGDHIDLVVESDSSLPPIEADPGQMEQVIVNLCVNARDAMPDGGSIHITSEAVSLDHAFCDSNPWAKPGEYVRVSVADSGEGIPQEVIEHIFEPFFTTKEVGKGTGLGLATVYAVVERHNGLIHVESTRSKGTCFSLYLPPSQGECATEDTTLPARSGKGEGIILLAEDDPLVRDLAVRILERAGYRVIVAEDGKEAETKFFDRCDDIDMAILDVMMPRRTGRQVYETIRETHPDMPVLFSSGHSFDNFEANFETNSTTRFLPKPYRPGELVSLVQEMFAEVNSTSR